MRTNADRNWDMLQQALAAETSGKSPRLFSSRKTLFGIPSALDQELATLDDTPLKPEDTTGASSPNHDGTGHANKPTAASACATGRSKNAADGARKPAKPTLVRHTIDPVFDANSRVLVLGTMPSPKSRETGFYYGHPQNRFWKVMAALFNEPLPTTNDEKRALALRHGVALWDVLSECTIEGASDGTIADCVPNDIGGLLAKAPIQTVFCTGAKATELYAKYCEPRTGRPCTRLPSTSPANAAKSLDQLVEAYRVILDYCK